MSRATLPSKLIFCASVCLLGLGCSASDDPAEAAGPNTDPDRNKVQPGELCERLAEIQCEGAAKCCPTAASANCMAEAVNRCRDTINLDTVAMDPRTGFDAAAAESAFTNFEQQAKSCDPKIAETAISPSGLRGVAKGTLAEGADCTAENMSNAVIIAAALASCANPATTACLPSDTPPWTCTARGPAGSPCFTDVNCQDGLFCDNPRGDLTGAMCAARKAAGEACQLANECASLACSSDGQCKPSGLEAAFCFE